MSTYSTIYIYIYIYLYIDIGQEVFNTQNEQLFQQSSWLSGWHS